MSIMVVNPDTNLPTTNHYIMKTLAAQLWRESLVLLLSISLQIMITSMRMVSPSIRDSGMVYIFIIVLQVFFFD